MQGKTVVMTGATSGIGEAAAMALARQGARIVFVARDPVRAEALAAALRAAAPAAEPRVVIGDLSRLSEIKRIGAEIAAAEPRIDVLINNAGAWFSHRTTTPDGLEATFALNHMAYFGLTEALAPSLGQTRGARVVSTASGAYRLGRLDPDEVERGGAGASRYSGFAAYARSKLCNVLWTRELARGLADRRITANCFHPGGVRTGIWRETPLLGRLLGPVLLSPEQGADTLVWLASSAEVEGATGGYYAKRKLQTLAGPARDDALAARLWAASERIVAKG